MPPKMEFQNSGTSNLEKSFDFDFEKVPTFKINIHGYWDTTSRNEMFMSQLRKLPFYKENLLYSGFDFNYAKNNTSIFCADESGLENTVSENENPVDYALGWGNAEAPTIGVYDPAKLEEDGHMGYRYKVLSPDALIALINLYEEGETPNENDLD